MYMQKGTAGEWVTANRHHVVTGGALGTVQALLDQVQMVFGDPDRKGTAQRKLQMSSVTQRAVRRPSRWRCFAVSG